jgi:hypothetical protein
MILGTQVVFNKVVLNHTRDHFDDQMEKFWHLEGISNMEQVLSENSK